MKYGNNKQRLAIYDELKGMHSTQSYSVAPESPVVSHDARNSPCIGSRSSAKYNIVFHRFNTGTLQMQILQIPC